MGCSKCAAENRVGRKSCAERGARCARSIYYAACCTRPPWSSRSASSWRCRQREARCQGSSARCCCPPSRNTTDSGEPRGRSSSSPNMTRPMSRIAIGRASPAPNTWTHRSSRHARSRSLRRYASWLGDDQRPLPAGSARREGGSAAGSGLTPARDRPQSQAATLLVTQV
jgi:hypothetical protein